MRRIDADALVAELKWLQSQVSSTSAMEIAEYIDRINAQPTVDGTPKWIPLAEKMPEKNNQWVLCLCVGGAMEVLKFDYTMWNWDSQYPGRCYMESYVTHWMPLPEPPKEDHHET